MIILRYKNKLILDDKTRLVDVLGTYIIIADNLHGSADASTVVQYGLRFLTLPWRLVSVNTIGRKIDFVGKSITESTKYFFFIILCFILKLIIQSKTTDDSLNFTTKNGIKIFKFKDLSEYIHFKLNCLYRGQPQVWAITYSACEGVNFVFHDWDITRDSFRPPASINGSALDLASETTSLYTARTESHRSYRSAFIILRLWIKFGFKTEKTKSDRNLRYRYYHKRPWLTYSIYW